MTTKKKTSKRLKASSAKPLSSVIRYTGPTHVPTELTDGVTVNLRESAGISTTSGGSLIFTDTNIPNSAQNWTDFAGVWNEYRVLAIEYEYVPYFKVNVSGVQDAPMVFTPLHTITTPTPSTYQTALAYGSPILRSLMTRCKVSWRMTSVDEADYLSTAAPAADCTTVLLFALGNNSISYGVLFYTYLIQFRSPRM
jgi:hypothetical protein